MANQGLRQRAERQQWESEIHRCCVRYRTDAEKLRTYNLAVAGVYPSLPGDNRAPSHHFYAQAVMQDHLPPAMPENPAQSPDDVASRPQVAQPDRRIVLYVEDNPANLALVTVLIDRRDDLTLLAATDGNAGLALARNVHPDVILMDINLPGINGFDALALLRLDPLTVHIPVIALSSNAFAGDIDKGLRAGFFRYLTKPFDINVLMLTIDLALALPAPTQGASATSPTELRR
jgi:CheY-like chemotaxis protein